MDRKEFLKSLGLLTAGAAIIPSEGTIRAAERFSGAGANGQSTVDMATDKEVDFPVKSLRANVKGGPVKVIIIGAGNRGRTYAEYARKFPECMQVVGVSDIRESRKNAMGDNYGIPAEHRFGDWSEVFKVAKFADAVVISTPDDLHYDPCMKALQWGYDVLLEKPVAQTEKECTDIAAQAHKYGRIVAVCHVLRYSPYFRAMYQTLRDGMIGKLISIQHMEPIECRHMAHSYVRGNWRDSKKTTPIILAKSCHDLDILRWFVGKPCKTIVADGSLTWFRPENAPEGAPKRCTDGCPHESTCPYSAIDIYVKRKQHLGVFDLKNSRDEQEIMSRISDPNNEWGRCVYFCDNDQPDHFVSEMVFEDGTTASFSMEAFTPFGGRRTRIMGTTGYIEGNGSSFTVYEFRSNRKLVWDKKVSEIPEYKGSGHGGGDMALVCDFLEAVSAHDESKLTSSIDASIESHVMGFRAEKSRLSNKKVSMK